MSLDDIINPAQISSLTALALAPGVLKTTMPFPVSSEVGILFVPAPARATATTVEGNSSVVSL